MSINEPFLFRCTCGCVCATAKPLQRRESHKFLGIVFLCAAEQMHGIGQESLKPTEMHELHAKLIDIVTFRNN